MDGVSGDIHVLLTARRCFQIIHHIPGRIRLRFDALRLMAVLGGRSAPLEAALARVDGIMSTEINAAARSLVVLYDPQRLPVSSWDHLLTGSDAAAVEVLRQRVPVSS